MSEVCKLLDIEKTRTTSLHPQSDGQVERSVTFYLFPVVPQNGTTTCSLMRKLTLLN